MQARQRGVGRRAGRRAVSGAVAVAMAVTVTVAVVAVVAAAAHRCSPVANYDRVETLRDDDRRAAIIEVLVHLHHRRTGCGVTEGM